MTFGPQVSTTPIDAMERAPIVDAMIVGEPEEGVLSIAALESLDGLSSVPTATYRKDGRIVPHRAHGQFAGFLTAPYPAWDLLDLAKYRLPLVDQPYVIVEASRGCPYSCDFCVAPIHQGHKFREKSAKALVDEIEQGYKKFGLKFFYLWGDTVTLNIKTFSAICDELIARKLPIQWLGNARADNLVDPEFVKRLRQAGCWMLALGIETESEETRKDMMKRLEGAEDPRRHQEHAHGGHPVVRVLHLRLSRRDAGVARAHDRLRGRPRSGLREFLSGRALPRHRAATPRPSATGCSRAKTGRGWSTRYYLLRGNGLDEGVVMGAINRAKRRFYLRPSYLARHAGDIARLAITKWSVAWHVASRVLFGTPVTDAATPAAKADQRAA